MPAVLFTQVQRLQRHLNLRAVHWSDGRIRGGALIIGDISITNSNIKMALPGMMIINVEDVEIESGHLDRHVLVRRT